MDFKAYLITLSLLLFTSSAIAEELPNYSPDKLKKGSITSVGSDTMGSLMQLWVESYNQWQKDAEIRIVSRGSATAPAALIDGSADIGPMSRPMKKFEVKEFTARYGFQPTQVKTAIAGVAVYVSASNPISEISLEDLDAIYSKNPKRAEDNINSWSSLGVSGELKGEKIAPFGRTDNSIPGYCFKQRALLQADYVDTVSQVASSQALLEVVRLNKNAIGFGEIVDTVPEGVKIIAIKESKDKAAVQPTKLALSSTQYPLSRYLNFYFVKDPGKKTDKATKDFLNFVLSKQGQEVVESLGLTPLSSGVIAEERAKY